MWIVKYKPKTLDEMIGNVHIINKVRLMIQSRRFQHMILCGSSGCGKTSLVDLIIEALLPKDKLEEALFYCSTCDDRSVQVLRDKLHDFVPKRISLPSEIPKIIVFKRADHLSESVQQTMRRLMDVYSQDAFFIFICNSLSGIIESIQSRCSILQWHPIHIEEYRELIARITFHEKNMSISSKGIELLYHLSHGGDLRWTVNYLEVLSLVNHVITEDMIKEFCISPYYQQLEMILQLISEKKIGSHLSIIQMLYNHGMNGIDLLIGLGDMVLLSSLFSDAIKIKMIQEIGITHGRFSSSFDHFLLFYNLLFSLQKLI